MMPTLENFLRSQSNINVIDSTIPRAVYVAIDLSAANPLLSPETASSAAALDEFIQKHIAKNNAKVAFGGYDEVRSIYQSSEIFNDNASDERNIHIGLDIWAPTGTAVLAAFDGTIHSFDFNPGKGNYGPTIILEHHVDGVKFFTLYGHLSLEDIVNIELGDEFKAGQPVGQLGDATVNGGYPPHLHFQIIGDIADYFGDYPGVCSISERSFFLNNCPDPNLLLKINKS